MRSPATLALGAALALGACVFSSERTLFGPSAGVTPIADGTRYDWIEDGSVAQTVTYRQVGRAYQLSAGAAGEQPLGVMFIAIPETPERDYIAQIELPGGEQSRAYAFMWRHGEGYRAISSPRAVGPAGEAALAANCASRPNSECQFGSRAALRQFYLSAIYPRFVAGDATPEDYIDQLPPGAEAPAPAKPTEGK